MDGHQSSSTLPKEYHIDVHFHTPPRRKRADGVESKIQTGSCPSDPQGSNSLEKSPRDVRRKLEFGLVIESKNAATFRIKVDQIED
jgi:hypothetical protein